MSLPRAPRELQDRSRCPWAVIPVEVWPWLSAWREWRHTGLVPLGASDLADAPAYVAEAILACEETAQQGERMQAQQAQAEMMAAMLGGGAVR